MKAKVLGLLTCAMILGMHSCDRRPNSHNEMIALLNQSEIKSFNPHNLWNPQAGLQHVDSLLRLPQSTPNQKLFGNYLRANLLLRIGEEDEAIRIFEDLSRDQGANQLEMFWQDLALAYLRQGERVNCIKHHAAESCIVPIQGLAIHTDPTGSTKAIEIYERLLAANPEDLESRWLLNLAYMTLGKYPNGVPASFFIPGVEGDTTYEVSAFRDIAAGLNLDVNNTAGGTIIEDFDGDGYLDIMLSCWGLSEPMRYFKNNADGTFTDLSDMVGLNGITGGLNMMQADYDNDGFKDVLVLRGAWKSQFGKEPNSLLRNNGDGTFTDVTSQSGLLSFHPTQTATWNDFNNDGWLDLFIGNETTMPGAQEQHPSELYMSNKDGTFRQVARHAKIELSMFVKGVTSGDYDNDGWKDIFVSTMNGQRRLFRNKGVVDNEVEFEDVTRKAGLAYEKGNSFPTWFWDFDNDGWLDIFTCDYSFNNSLAYYMAAENLNVETGNPHKMLLYKNNRDGTFTNVADEVGLDRNVFAMGSNFGDIDNDGFLDMFFGTGNPDYKSILPNKMFKNIDGKMFADVTNSARVGNLQKGHGVSFGDMDNDGDQDIYIDMGGAYPGDPYQNSFFLNPGLTGNNWICIDLEGTKSNRSAIGTQVKITFSESGIRRSVYREVNSGGSFGASPLRREVGIGKALAIDSIEIKWHGSNNVQVFKDVKPNQFIKITEGSEVVETISLKSIEWKLPKEGVHHHTHLNGKAPHSKHYRELEDQKRLTVAMTAVD